MPGRYQFSLPERRQRDGWFRIGTIDVTTTALLVILGVLSMFVYAFDQVTLTRLYFFSPYVRRGDVWRVVTWPLANPPEEIWVIITLAFFWFVGHWIEDVIGRRRFTALILAMTIIPAAFVTLFDFTNDTGLAYGLGILATGLLVLYALDKPGAMFFFGIPLWVLAAVFVGIDVLRLLGNRLYGQLVLELGVIVVGVVGGRQCGLVDSLTFIPSLASGSRQKRKPAPRRGKQRPTTASAVITGPWATTTHSPADQVELDRLLDKIGATGMDSLSKAEKQHLNELSKRLRGG
ncbi:MAG: rhomboid family intramembrane serine protease [Ilumatobacteraceae bacterium]